MSLYGLALVSRIEKNVGLFCKRAPQKRQYSAKETFHLIDPTNRSHPIYQSEGGYNCVYIIYVILMSQEKITGLFCKGAP